MRNQRHRWIRRLAAGLAFAAIVTPAAQARIVDEGGGGLSGAQEEGYYGSYGYQHGTGVPVDRQKEPVVRMRADVGSRGAQASDGTVAARPDDSGARFVPAPRGLVLRRDPGAAQQAPELVAQPSSGFDWSDAGIGAGMAVGVVLIALSTGLATRRAGHKSLAGT